MELMVSQPQRNIAATPKAVRMPVIYEEAVRDLILCQSLDEAKYFADKAEALSAWAKIYKDDQACLEAKRLKLHAYRRMGQIAGELRPVRQYSRANGVKVDNCSHKGKRGDHYLLPGPISLLQENGIERHKANAMRQVAKIPEPLFQKLVVSGVSPTRARMLHTGRSSSAWSKFNQPSTACLPRFVYFCRAQSAKDMASQFTDDEAKKARGYLIEAQEWLDEFERFLPKESK